MESTGLESYLINQYGVVKALPKIREGRLDVLNNHDGTSNKSQRHYKERIIKPSLKSNYLYVQLMHNGIRRNYRVHRLVYNAFVGPIPNNRVIDHIDGNKTNNCIDNLRCVTVSENCRNENTKYNKCKSILQIDKNTQEILNEFKSIADASVAMGKIYELKNMGTHISDCCKGKRHTAFGFCWKYKE